MSPIELRAARETLGLTVEEAAEHIGGVSRRSWVYFESGHRTIQPDTVRKTTALIDRRRQILQAAQKQMIRAGGNMTATAVIYYPTAKFCQSVLEWRFSQSLARELAAAHGAQLVLFDKSAYDTWRTANGAADSEQTRAAWAAHAAHQSAAPSETAPPVQKAV